MEAFSRRHLPHYDVSHATYFVTACLAGSIPSTGVLAPKKPVGATLRPGDAGRQRWCDAEDFSRTETWLDERTPVRWLADRRLASIVRCELLRAARESIDLHAFVIMPSHVHLVFTPRREFTDLLCRRGERLPPRSIVMRAIKGRSAVACNRLLRRAGAFWQSESYDRVVRDETELEDVIAYVEHNPVKAALCPRPADWQFSSAHVGQASACQNVGQASACQTMNDRLKPVLHDMP